MAVVITSTTSPQEELDHAVSDEWRKPLEPKPIEVPAKPEVEEPETPPAEGAEGEQPAPKPKEHKSGWQKRIDKLTARNHMLESRVAELETAKPKPAEESSAVKGPAEPKLADFGNDVEKFIVARDEWKQAEQQRTAQAETHKAIVDSYNEKVSQARGNYDDWDEVVAGSKIVIPKAAVDAVIELDNGPDVAYYLAQHPEEAEALKELTPIRTIQVIGKLSDKIAAEKAAPVPKPKVKPTEPISPVGASSTRSSVPLDQLSPREYIKIRNKQERENKRF